MISRTTKRLAHQGAIHLLGYLPVLDAGRPPAVYGWHAVKLQDLHHEIQVTRAWLAIARHRPHQAKRLKFVDKHLRPDMELTFDDAPEDHLYVELDTGSWTHSQLVEKRWVRYQFVPTEHHQLLVITSSPDRLNNLMKDEHVEAIAHIARFTTLDQLIATPADEIWCDCSGKMHTV